MKGNLSLVLPWLANAEPVKGKRRWEGNCPICGRFQDSMKVCSECVDDGLEQRTASFSLDDLGRISC